MSARDGKFTPATLEYLQGIEAKLDGLSSEAIAARVSGLVAEHEEWRGRRCLNLNPAETVMSRRARALLASDMATRLTEGFPGDKEYPPPRQNVYIDEIEAIIIAIARRMFHAEHVEWRPVSTSMANAAVFFALTKPGERIMAQSPQAGGNYSYNPVGTPRVAGLEVTGLPHQGNTFEIDMQATRELAKKVRPRMLVVGGSNVLFPYPVEELRTLADELDALVIYDAAHLGLLIAAGIFQDPLREGAHVMTISTHKIMSGAVGGLVLTNDESLAERILGLSFPAVMQTRDQNKYAATAHALAEMQAYGVAFATQTVANARALAAALERESFTCLAADRGYTDSHQIFLDLPDIGGQAFESRCQQANILVAKSQHMGTADQGGESNGARLTSQEITRQGMKEHHMTDVARFIRRVVIDGEPPDRVARNVEAFLEDFHRIDYSFDD